MGRSFLFSDDGSVLFSGDFDGVIRLWDVESLEQRFTFLTHPNISDLAMSDDGKVLVAGSSDGIFQVLRAATKEEVEATDWQLRDRETR
jgi:WD40 repeat protein